MKKRKDGQKVQNWHRPLAPHAVGRWFRRHRYDPADSIDEAAAAIGEPDWDAWGDWAEEEVRPREDEIPDHRFVELKQLLREIVHRPPLLFRPEWAMDAALESVDECSFTSTQEQSPECLEQRLADHANSITHFPNSPAMQQQIRDAVGDDVYLDVRNLSGKPGDHENLIKNLYLFAPFWIRSPRTWLESRSSLVDHLLVRYEVPAFFPGSGPTFPIFPG